jgi:hypothetical protein
MKNSFLTVVFVIQVCFSYAQSSSVNFTAYNCSLTSFDTTLIVTSADTLNFVSFADGTTNLFYSVNNQVIDTISVSTGNVIQQHIVSPGDTVIQFLVWTNPGSCYGQRFHLIQPANVYEKVRNEIKLFYNEQNHELIVQNENFDELIIYAMNGKAVGRFSLDKFCLNTVKLSNQQHGVHHIVLKNNQFLSIKKLFLY